MGRQKARRTRGPRRRVPEPAFDFAVAQMFRRECSSCGFSVLAWFTGAEAAAVLGAVVAGEVLRWLPEEEALRAACWQCQRCGESGAFGDTFVM